MTVVCPVTKRLPSTSALWNETNLPLSCVVTPFAMGHHESSSAVAPPLVTIPKCLHCGAPHPTKASYFPLGGYELLCKLCQQKSSTKFDDQEEFRLSEIMDPNLYQGISSRSSIHKMYLRSDGTGGDDGSVTCEFELPLWNTEASTFASTTTGLMPVTSSPAMSCPPIWWILVDGTCSLRTYWDAIEDSLTAALKSIPSHIHVGLLVMTAGSTISSWDLSSSVPHVRHYSINTETATTTTTDPLSQLRSLGLNLVPANSRYLPNIQAALRALGDCRGNVHQANSRDNQQNRPPLGLALELVLDFMSQAIHPGQDTNTTTSTNNTMTYAGGKVLCYLSGPTHEMELVDSSTRDNVYKGTIGTGGRGGSCAEYGLRFSTHLDTDESLPNDHTDPTDMTPTNLARRYSSSRACHGYYQDLGVACARAALGIDLILLIDNSKNDDTPTTVGVPFLRVLADKSGAPGPIIFGLSDIEKQGLEREVLSRTPWHRPTAYGTWFRVRLSPGLTMDKSNPSVDEHADDGQSKSHKAQIRLGPNLADTYGCGGLHGPASLASESNDNKNDVDNDMLWMMGCCDVASTVTLDMDVVGYLKDAIYLEGYGDVALKPCLQLSFAYTTLVQNEAEEWMTVRRLRITTVPMSVAYDTETLYASLDPNALAVALFHKLTVTSLRDGLLEAQVAGQFWLVNLLVCVYRSAKKYALRLDEHAGHGPVDSESVFYRNQRLLDGGSARRAEGDIGELSTKDILLCQGHELLSAVPSLLFAILQCDALRPCQGSFQPTLDARCAASCQMFSMTPLVLSKCVAPTLGLWSSSKGDIDNQEPIMEQVNLSMRHLEAIVQEHQQNASGGDELVVLSDSPRHVMVYNCQKLPGSKLPVRDLVMSDQLRRCVEEACQRYRVPPPMVDGLSSDQEDPGSLTDALVEDSTTVDGLGNFQQWRNEIATLVHEELLKASVVV